MYIGDGDDDKKTGTSEDPVEPKDTENLPEDIGTKIGETHKHGDIQPM